MFTSEQLRLGYNTVISSAHLCKEVYLYPIPHAVDKEKSLRYQEVTLTGQHAKVSHCGRRKEKTTVWARIITKPEPSDLSLLGLPHPDCWVKWCLSKPNQWESSEEHLIISTQTLMVTVTYLTPPEVKDNTKGHHNLSTWSFIIKNVYNFLLNETENPPGT